MSAITESRGVLQAEDRSVSLGSLPLRPLKEDEVLIRVHYSPVHPSDIIIMKGFNLKPLPAILGGEGSGEVIEVGSSEDVQKFKGKKVAFFTYGNSYGAWGEYVIAPKAMTFLVPQSLTFEEASTAIANPLTVQGMIYKSEADGHKAIVHAAAASAIGRMLVPAAKQAGIGLINIVRRPEQVKILKDLGAEIVLDSSSASFWTDFDAKVALLKPTAFWDPAIGKLGQHIFEHLPDNSTTYIYGQMSDEKWDLDIGMILKKNKIIRGYQFFETLMNPVSGPKIFELAMKNLESKLYSTKIAKIVGHEQYQEAIDHSNNNATEGKVLIKNPYL